MSTLADLKLRIADELTRDDMGAGGDSEDALARAIDSAISYYADEMGWFNHLNDTATTSGGTAALPTGMRYATRVSYLQCPLIQADLDELQPLTDTGPPARWAMDGDTIYLWPIPDDGLSLSVQGIADFGAASFPPEHYDLIAARAKVSLCRFPLRDTEGLQLAVIEEREALARVRQESRKRGRVPLRSPDFPSPQWYRNFNINPDLF